MFRHLFRSRKETRPTRPVFRPALENLESREVPTNVAQVSAALQELPGAINNLGINIAAQNVKNGEANFNIIRNNVQTLSNNAIFFAPGPRLQIDTALFTGGFQLYQDSFQLLQLGDQQDANLVAQVGVQAVLGGYFDYLAMSNGISKGNLTLS